VEKPDLSAISAMQMYFGTVTQKCQEELWILRGSTSVQVGSLSKHQQYFSAVEE